MGLAPQVRTDRASRWCFRATPTADAPDTPLSTAQQRLADNYVPVDWGLNASLTMANRYLWASIRRGTTGAWGAFGAPMLWGRFAVDGQGGGGGEMQFTPQVAALLRLIAGHAESAGGVLTWDELTRVDPDNIEEEAAEGDFGSRQFTIPAASPGQQNVVTPLTIALPDTAQPGVLRGGALALNITLDTSSTIAGADRPRPQRIPGGVGRDRA